MSSETPTDVSYSTDTDQSATVPADTGDDLVDEKIEAACAEGDIGHAARIRLNAQNALEDAPQKPLVTTASLPDDLASTMTSVYAHRQEHDAGDTDFVFCSTAMVTPSIEEAAVPATKSTIEWVETQVFAEFDGEDEPLDELLPTEDERQAAGDIPARVGRLFIDGGRVVALELREAAFEEQETGLVTDGGETTCGKRSCDRTETVSISDGRGRTKVRCGLHALEDAVAGVGPSKAEQLIEEIGSLEEICYAAKHQRVRIARLDGWSPSSAGELESKLKEAGVWAGPGEEEPVTDGGGVTWTDLTGFKRDCLEAIRRLDNDGETTYGLAIKRELERQYGEEILHGRLYPNLDDLVDADLVEKSELDKRTNSYDLTAEGKAMLEQRARLLADACGMEQPVADGGGN